MAQTNIGHTYINRTLEAMGIEPASICSGHNLQLDKKRKGDSLRKKTIDFKRRRNHDTNKNEQQEGKTYQSNVGLTLDKTSTPQQQPKYLTSLMCQTKISQLMKVQSLSLHLDLHVLTLFTVTTYSTI